MARSRATKKTGAVAGGVKRAPCVAPGSPKNYRVRVRMYRQGLGDCFLVTFPRGRQAPFQMLIDCGALARDAPFMTRIVEHIRDTVRQGEKKGKARLDVVVATHEHKDHLSGFNQARKVFNNDFDFGAVWLGWTENLTKPEIKEIKEARKKAAVRLRAALDSPLAAAAGEKLDGVAALLGFSEDDDTTGAGKLAEALEYLKLRGKDAGDLQYLDPGTEPVQLEGVKGVRVYVLGPPRDPILLKGSRVTEEMKRQDVVYHLAGTGDAGLNALSAALPSVPGALPSDRDRYFPFSAEHRIAPEIPDPANPNVLRPDLYFEYIRPFVSKTYDDPAQAWRRIDHDWLGAFGQLALDLDNDTNNTSLVLAFEFVKTEEVLLFVGDAQVGNWQSWATVEFNVPGRAKPLPAHDLLNRVVFYKVGHHCSHNATLKKAGLELMIRDDLVAFIPLDRETAAKQGKKDPVTKKPKGWAMPAPPLYKALMDRAGKRVVVSDVKDRLTPEVKRAGVIATDTYIDYFLK
jgi:glyoxylase-like metal-dependent hydrolase (beta-lactamase superfamily II)